MLPHPLLPAALQASYLKAGLWRDEDLYRVLGAQASARAGAPLYLEPAVVTYGEAFLRARVLARRLLRVGGGPVVAPLVNGWPAAVVSAGVAGAGGILAPLPGRSTPAQVLRLAAALEAPTIIISGRVLKRSEWDASFLARLAAEAPSVREVLLADPVEAPGWAVSALTTLDAAVAGPDHELALPVVDAGAVGLLLSTGGTTGPAKLVAHSHTGIAYSARQYQEACRLGTDDRLLQVGPFGHASGTIFTLYTAILAGAAIAPLPIWSAAAFAEAVARTEATWTLLSGTHVHDLLTLPAAADSRLATLRGMSAGSGSDRLFGEAERRFGIVIQRMYGLTECLGNSIMPATASAERRMVRDGLAFAGVEHLVVRPGTRAELRAGETGEMLVRGPSLFAGYHGRLDLTAEVVDADGFFRTGDLMTRDELGYVTYVGRMKDVIRRGGVNIDPMEVERVLITHPAIADCAVIGIHDERLGERPAAAVVLRDGPPPELADLVDYLAEREIPPVARPEFLYTLGALPLTEFGKHDKVALRKLLAEDAAR